MTAKLEVRAPFDGAVITTIEETRAETIEAYLARADELHRRRDARLPDSERMEILLRAAEIMTERAEELALMAAREGGKPLIDSRVEVARAIEGLKLCEHTLKTQCGSQIPMNSPASANRFAFTFLEPIGPVVAVSAFNHPLNLIVHQAGPAIAAGCPVIVKPATDTPLSCLAFLEIMREAGLPEDWCRVVISSDNDLAEKMVTDPRVAFMSFIGSARVGWMLRSKLAPGTRCALEHGGVAPVVVLPDADLDDVVPRLLKGAFYHAGQVCVSVQRIFVHESIAREFAERMAKGADELVVGDPTDEKSEVGPLIRISELERVESWIDEAREEGAELLSGGARVGETAFRPTVLYAPSSESRVSREEVFGPVVCIYPFAEVEDAVAQANSLPFAFQASICTRDIDCALDLAQRIDASAVMINDHTAFRVDWMPFAGLRQSGLGVGGIEHTMRDMQIEKMVVIRSHRLGTAKNRLPRLC